MIKKYLAASLLIVILMLGVLSCVVSPTATTRRTTASPPAQTSSASALPPNTPPVTLSVEIITTTPSPTSLATPPSSPPPTTSPLPRNLTYRVVRTYPHDPSAFTEGLVYENGFLYEGTGLNGRSFLRKVDLTSGASLQQRNLPADYFGEGITIFGERIFQLTWQSNVGFIYRKDNFAPTGSFTYHTEGWGLTQDGRRLLMSDGTASLHSLDPVTLNATSTVQVKDRGQPLKNINELEYINDLVYANIWLTDLIAVIDPADGNVLSWIDLTGLLDKQKYPGVDVLNGIAYDAAGKRLFVTGKFWPLLFEIELIPTA